MTTLQCGVLHLDLHPLKAAFCQKQPIQPLQNRAGRSTEEQRGGIGRLSMAAQQGQSYENEQLRGNFAEDDLE